MTGCISPAAGILERAIALVHLTQGRVGEDHLVSARQKHAASVHVRTTSSSESPTTVGIMFEESSKTRHVVVNNVMFGGPAYTSKQIAKGDSILRVDGMELHSSDNILTALNGCQIPGSSVTITIKKAGTGEVKDVELFRMMTAEIADKRRMFDLFTRMECRAKQQKDDATLKEVEEVLSILTDMMEQEQEKDARYEASMQAMQGDCNSWLEELSLILEKLDRESELHTRKANEDRELLITPRSVPESATLTKCEDLCADMKLAELISFCEAVCADLKQNSSANVTATPSTKYSSRRKISKTTIGVMLHGVVIDNMIEGGPAHKSNQLEQGDIVLKVDGRDVTEDTLPGMVIGSDIPGSIVTLTVQKASQEVKRDVTIRRMAREAMEHQVTIFEHFTNIKEEAAGQDEVVACVDACMDYWFGMLKSANDRDAVVEANVRQMQDKSVRDAARLTEALMRMREFSSDRQELEELYNHTEKGLEARKDELVSLNKEFANTRQQILEKAKLYVQQERTAARRAMQEAENAARKEVQETKKSAQEKEEELRAALQKAESEAQLTLKQAISDAQKQCSALTEEKADLDRQLRRCQADLQHEAKRAQELGSDLKLKSVQINSLQEQVDELKTRMKDETAAKQAELDDKKRDLAGLLQSLTEKQAFEKSMLADLKESSNALGKTQQELRKAQEDCADLRSQLKEAMERLESLQKSSEATIQDLQRCAQEESARLKSSMQRLTNELSLSDTQKRAYEEAQRKVKTRAITLRLRNRMVVRFFEGWCESAAESRRMKAISRKVVMRMKSRLLVECFVSWYDNTQEELRLKTSAHQMLLRLMNIGLAKSFDRWSTRVAEEKHLRATVRKVVLRMMNLCLVGAFEGWREHAEEQKRMRDVARRVVQRWVKSSLVICFETWRSIAEEEMFKQDEERVRQNEERLQEETENQKMTSTQLKSQLEHERREWEAAKKELESKVEALTTDLNDKVGEVQIVKVQTQRAQRAVIDTQKKLDDTTTKQVQHRERTVDKLAQRLLRKTTRDEFDCWRELTSFAHFERRVEWLEDNLREKERRLQEASENFSAQEERVEELRHDLHAKTQSLEAKLGECQLKTEESLTSMKAQLDSERTACAKALSEAEASFKRSKELEGESLKARAEAAKAEETLAQHLRKSAAELTAKQMDMERLNASLESALAAKESMKHDFAAMNDELTEYRFKLGEKGFKLTPRKHMSFTEDEQEERMRFSAEQKYLKSKNDARGGKYFMC